MVQVHVSNCWCPSRLVWLDIYDEVSQISLTEKVLSLSFRLGANLGQVLEQSRKLSDFELLKTYSPERCAKPEMNVMNASIARARSGPVTFGPAPTFAT